MKNGDQIEGEGRVGKRDAGVVVGRIEGEVKVVG